ncbi:hypothetical protein KR054_001463, partial [Drosophila jambulina]
MRALVLGIFGIFCLSVSAEYLEPNCGIGAGPRIFNGRDANINSHPWMAYLYSDNIVVCGGTLIHPRKARLGEYDYMTRQDCTVHGCSPSSEEHNIDMFLQHDRFSIETGANDIALLRLSRPVDYKAHIRPICIIVDPWEWNLADLKDFTATGWGDTRTNRTRGTLQEVTLQRYDRRRCQDVFPRVLRDDQFCAGSPYGDTCLGDSGGPLGKSLTLNRQTRYVQLGVVSYGSHNCTGVGVYSDLVAHVTWIQRTVQTYKD